MDGRETKIDAALTAFSMAYRVGGLIADIVCPRVPVEKDSAKYYIFGSENMKDVVTVRAPKSGPNIITQEISTASYQTNGHSLAGIIDDLDRARAPFNLESNTVETVMDKMLIRQEIETYDLFKDTANYASANFYTTLSGEDQFDAPGGGPDVEDLVDSASAVVRTACGTAPNTLVIPWKVAKVMKRMSQIQDQRKNAVDLTQQAGLPPTLWGYNVLVAGSIHDSANKGQTKSFADIWSDKMWLMYLNPNTNWKSQAFAKNFVLGTRGFFVNRAMIPSHEMPYNAEMIEVVQEGRDPVVVGDSCAYMWQDVLAS